MSDELRERIRLALVGAYYDYGKGAWSEYTDAVMTVVQPELSELDYVLRESQAEAQHQWERAERAEEEIEQWRATYGRDALPGALRRLEKAEATIERMTQSAKAADEGYRMVIAPLQAALERVRQLHREEYGCCVACMHEASVPWPCDTIRALDGESDG